MVCDFVAGLKKYLVVHVTNDSPAKNPTTSENIDSNNQVTNTITASNTTKTNSGPTVYSANRTDMTTTHTITVILYPDISHKPQQGNILNGLATGLLISIRQLWNK